MLAKEKFELTTLLSTLTLMTLNLIQILMQLKLIYSVPGLLNLSSKQNLTGSRLEILCESARDEAQRDLLNFDLLVFENGLEQIMQ